MKTRFFTLIEILGVIVLISILTAIGVGGYMYAMDSSKESATAATIKRVEAGVDALINDGLMQKTSKMNSDVGNGYVTITVNPDPTADNRLMFGDTGKYTNADKLKAAYKSFTSAIDADNISKSINSDNQLTDGWGNPIYIRYPGKFNRGGVDIISAGSNGKFGKSAADTIPVAITDYCDDGEWVCDDVANFQVR